MTGQGKERTETYGDTNESPKSIEYQLNGLGKDMVRRFKYKAVAKPGCKD